MAKVTELRLDSNAGRPQPSRPPDDGGCNVPFPSWPALPAGSLDFSIQSAELSGEEKLTVVPKAFGSGTKRRGLSGAPTLK